MKHLVIGLIALISLALPCMPQDQDRGDTVIRDDVVQDSTLYFVFEGYSMSPSQWKVYSARILASPRIMKLPKLRMIHEY